MRWQDRVKEILKVNPNTAYTDIEKTLKKEGVYLSSGKHVANSQISAFAIGLGIRRKYPRNYKNQLTEKTIRNSNKETTSALADLVFKATDVDKNTKLKLLEILL